MKIKSKRYVANSSSVFAPSTKIGISCTSITFKDEEVQKILKEYDCLSFSFCNGYIYILLDILFEY